MAKKRKPRGSRAEPHLPDPGLGDRDVDLKAVFIFAGILTTATTAILAAVWGLSVHFRADLAASDPPPPLLPEARAGLEARLPPAPRLEEDPARSLAEHRAREDAVLGGWAWTDRERGVARIPIERAIDLVLEKGLGAAAPAATEPPGQGSASPPAGGNK